MRDITPVEAKQRIAEGAVLIDVRELHEWHEAHVAEARHMPLMEVPERLHEFPRDREVVLICRSGRRSGNACDFLVERGFDGVFNLAGGMLAWVQAGLPVER
ncbi:MAG TPA: rhodanese-like domain-containing protein [Candidatus Dormibacteraeota bacterium]|nr:rhodanese-like domain-containing protein [Candidatus Dormibacteraeota bacterium]